MLLHRTFTGGPAGLKKAAANQIPPNLPPEMKVDPICDDQTLSGMLLSGELTALVSAREPSCFSPDHPEIVRLFPDFRAAEKEWYAKTGLFPIMHVLGIRKELVEREPWIATSVLKAFTQAKDVCLEEMSDVTALAVSMPWIAAELRETQELMGDDIWPYGFQENLGELSVMCRWSKAQGLAAREITGGVVSPRDAGSHLSREKLTWQRFASRGSVPYDTAEEVFETFGAGLGAYLAAVPDGEIGPANTGSARSIFRSWQRIPNSRYYGIPPTKTVLNGKIPAMPVIAGCSESGTG